MLWVGYRAVKWNRYRGWQTERLGRFCTGDLDKCIPLNGENPITDSAHLFVVCCDDNGVFSRKTREYRTHRP